MSWRWLQRIRLPFGVNANLSRGGVGWSWGIPGIRVGVSPSGRKWLSLGIPGTGFRIFRFIDEFWGTNQGGTEHTEVFDDEVFDTRSGQVPPEKPIIKWKNIK